MKALALLLAFAGTAAAQAPEQPKPDAAQRPALNLRLDETSGGAQRITFGQRPAATTKEEREKGLPELGGKPALNFDRPLSPSSAGSPIPKDPMMPE